MNSGLTTSQFLTKEAWGGLASGTHSTTAGSSRWVSFSTSSGRDVLRSVTQGFCRPDALPVTQPVLQQCPSTIRNSEFWLKALALSWSTTSLPRVLCRFSHCSTPVPPHTTTTVYGPFSGSTRVSRCQKRTLDFTVQGQINRERQTHRLGATPSRVTGAHLHDPPIFLQAGCPSCRPTNSVKALKATALKATPRQYSDKNTVKSVKSGCIKLLD